MVIWTCLFDTKGSGNGGMEIKKDIRHTKNKQINDECKSYVITSYSNVNGLNFLIKRLAE